MNGTLERSLGGILAMITLTLVYGLSFTMFMGGAMLSLIISLMLTVFFSLLNVSILIGKMLSRKWKNFTFQFSRSSIQSELSHFKPVKSSEEGSNLVLFVLRESSSKNLKTGGSYGTV